MDGSGLVTLLVAAFVLFIIWMLFLLMIILGVSAAYFAYAFFKIMGCFAR